MFELTAKAEKLAARGFGVTFFQSAPAATQKTTKKKATKGRVSARRP
jgi:hypothetical protein